MSKIHSRIESFKFAFQGIKSCLKEEPNFKIHTTLGVLAIVLAYFLKFTYTEWLILFIAEALVFAMEAVNTSIESMINILSPERRIEAKRAKDTAAAAVLFASILAIVVGVILFIPKLLPLLQN